MSVTILISIIWHNGLAPESSTLKIDVINICTSVYNIDIDTLATFGSVEILVVSADAQGFSVRDSGQTPWGILLKLAGTVIFATKGVHEGVSFDEIHLEEIVVRSS